MKGTNGPALMNRDSHLQEFIRSMNSDGIPVKTFQEDNWKRWIQDQFERVINYPKNKN